MLPATATNRTAGTEIIRIAVNITRPPNRSVKAPTTMRPTAPTSTGVASMREICPSLSPMLVA